MAVKKVKKYTDFLKRASVESDMAKRIMLSIIPSLRGSTENYLSGGFDIKALEAAAAGAKLLIKYGTMACVQEVRHYGSSPSGDHVATPKYRGAYSHAKELMHDGEYARALSVCVNAFSDSRAWDSGYGGKAWGKIADTLSKIAETWYLLKTAQGEDRLELLKEIVILMNVFDGLAHNSGNIMPKLIYQEVYDELGRKAPNPELDYEEDYGLGKLIGERQRQVAEMMHAKEFDNPIDVYKQIEPIIDSGPYRYLFKDWIHKLRQHPGYTRSVDEIAVQEKIARIELRKESADTKKKLLNIISETDKDLAALHQNIDMMSPSLQYRVESVLSCIGMLKSMAHTSYFSLLETMERDEVAEKATSSIQSELSRIYDAASRKVFAFRNGSALASLKYELEGWNGMKQLAEQFLQIFDRI